MRMRRPVHVLQDVMRDPRKAAAVLALIAETPALGYGSRCASKPNGLMPEPEPLHALLYPVRGQM